MRAIHTSRCRSRSSMTELAAGGSGRSTASRSSGEGTRRACPRRSFSRPRAALRGETPGGRAGLRKKAAATRSSILNALFYQVGWFACVLGAAGGWGDLGASIAVLLALAHLALAERPEREWPLMLAAVSIGIVVESFHAQLGILEFHGLQAGLMAPLWMIALWLQFATVFHFCLRWLSGRYLLASLLGLIGGPLTFLGGERLGAAVLGEPRLLSLAVLALSWSLALPTLVMIADRVGGRGVYRIFPRAVPAEA